MLLCKCTVMVSPVNDNYAIVKPPTAHFTDRFITTYQFFFFADDLAHTYLCDCYAPYREPSKQIIIGVPIVCSISRIDVFLQELMSVFGRSKRRLKLNFEDDFEFY